MIFALSIGHLVDVDPTETVCDSQDFFGQILAVREDENVGRVRHELLFSELYLSLPCVEPSTNVFEKAGYFPTRDTEEESA